MSKEEIIKEIESLSPSEEAIQGILELYNKEKEKNKELTDEYMIQKHLINADFLNDYISKDKIERIIDKIYNIYEDISEVKNDLEELLEERND